MQKEMSELFTHSKAYQEQIKEAAKCDAVFDGGIGVRKYLIQQSGESKKGFVASANQSACGTTFRKGVTSIRDILFRNPLTYSEDMPFDYYETADGKRSLNEVAKDITTRAILNAKVYVLVSTPPNTAKNAKEEQEQGIRPYMEVIPASRILDRVIKRDSAGNLTQIGIMGTYVIKEGRYEDETKPEARVYFNDGLTEIWREDEKGKWVNAKENNIQSGVKKLHVLEFTYDHSDKPPFINEANYQLQHYNIERVKDRYNMKLGVPRVVTWGLLGNDTNVATHSTDDNGKPITVIEFNADKGINFSVNPDTGAKLGDVETKELDGKNDAVLKRTLDDKKKAIADGFISVTEETTGNKTTEQSENERVAGESALSQLGNRLEHFLNQIHGLFCDFTSQPVKGYVSVNKEFIETGMTELRYKILNEMYADEIIDRKSYLQELQNAGEIETVDIEEVEARMVAIGK